jgi:hypothetical protein
MEVAQTHGGNNLRFCNFRKRSVLYEKYEFNAEAQGMQRKDGRKAHVKKNRDLCHLPFAPCALRQPKI